jgi:leader peptidase (prepilin peptidase)/N-methyltransferase
MTFLPLLACVILGTHLAVVDLREHRLPNRLVAQMTVVVGVTMVIAVVAGLPAQRATDAAVTSLKTVAVYAVVYLVSAGQFGMGDVKFALPLGAVVGWYSPDLWLPAIGLAFVLAAVASVALIVTRRISVKGRVAFGPYMLAATVAMCL